LLYSELEEKKYSANNKTINETLSVKLESALSEDDNALTALLQSVCDADSK
jgi:hypothetical protein